MNKFTEEVIRRFENPTHVGELPLANGIGSITSKECGDTTQIHLQIKDNIIVDAKFKTYGCAAAIASADMATELIIGMSIEDAQKMTIDDIVQKLGGLPEHKIHCSVLGADAVKAAIENFQRSNAFVQSLVPAPSEKP